MKMHYNTAINDRKGIAQGFAEKMNATCAYDKHIKGYVVMDVHFLQNGIIEGTMSKTELETLSLLLLDWEFIDAESKAEYAEMVLEAQVTQEAQEARLVDDYQIPDEPVTPDADTTVDDVPTMVDVATTTLHDTPTTPDADTVDEADDVSMTITLRREGITDEAYEVLLKLINSHATLIMKALGTTSLDVEREDGMISFPWFRHPSNDEEQIAYYDFINHLLAKAKSSKIVYEAVASNNDEKYIFSKFLYRLGIDGAGFKRTRSILMKNLDGAIWKNLTSKKRKAERDAAKRAAEQNMTEDVAKGA
jgi:hypothetical protein